MKPAWPQAVPAGPLPTTPSRLSLTQGSGELSRDPGLTSQRPGQEAKIGVVNTQPASAPPDRLEGEGRQGPLGIYSVALRANKTSVMDEGQLPGWLGAEGRDAWFCVRWLWLGDLGAGDPGWKCPRMRLSPAGDFLREFPRKVEEEGAGNREERKGV